MAQVAIRKRLNQFSSVDPELMEKEEESVSCSAVSDPFVNLSTVAHQAICSWNSPGMNTEVGSLFLLRGDLPGPGIEPRSPALQAVSLPSEPLGTSLAWCQQ